MELLTTNGLLGGMAKLLGMLTTSAMCTAPAVSRAGQLTLITTASEGRPVTVPRGESIDAGCAFERDLQRRGLD